MAVKKKLTFEEAMTRLEGIVTRLEQGDTPLEEALALFEEGTGLMKQCSKSLDEAEQKVRKLFPGGDGQPVEEDMDPYQEVRG